MEPSLLFFVYQIADKSDNDPDQEIWLNNMQKN